MVGIHSIAQRAAICLNTWYNVASSRPLRVNSAMTAFSKTFSYSEQFLQHKHYIHSVHLCAIYMCVYDVEVFAMSIPAYMHENTP